MQENSTWDAEEEWWSDAQDVSPGGAALSSLLLLGGEVGFVPPPPRPSLFVLEELGSEVFTATCDLCDWAWRDQANANRTLVLPVAVLGGELGWLLTLAAVALLSAVVGATVMVTVMHCRRLKNLGHSGCCSSDSDTHVVPPSPGEIHAPHGPGDGVSKTPPLPDTRRPSRGALQGIPWWRRLLSPRPGSRNGEASSSLQRRAPRRLCPPAPPASENHYTVTEPSGLLQHPLAATPVPEEEALYAELHERAGGYQNTGYMQVSEPDLPSAPSSAYYSDLSCGERTYEAVQEVEDTCVSPTLESTPPPQLLQTSFARGTRGALGELVLNTVACRIATITKTVPSDYV